MLKLSTILWIDDQFDDHCALALVECVGDQYLLTTNPIFRRFREVSLNHGAEFSTHATESWCDYRTAPLFCLGQIIETRVIPYIQNASTIRRIVTRVPDVQLPACGLAGLVQRNVILHESAHLSAEAILDKQFPPSGNKLELVERSFVAESFANAAECMANVFAIPDMHRLFLSMNSYVATSRVKSELLRTSLSVLGGRNLLRLGMLSYLYLNSHDSSINDRFFSQAVDVILEGQVLSRVELQITKLLMTTVFTLNLQFRAETTPLFFSLYGATSEYYLFAQKFVDPYTLNDRIYSMIDTLVDSVFTGNHYSDWDKVLEKTGS